MLQSQETARGVKLRLDRVLVERGLAATRNRAQERIVAGQVAVDGVVATKPGFLVAAHQAVNVRGEDFPFVSRGGLKLVAALEFWNIDVTARICLDVGVSTGGFSDCMLQRGAARIIGIDSGHSQLATSLRSDSRLLLMERTNARYLTASMLPPGISFIAMDVSFIAASLLLPAVIASAFPASDGEIVQQREVVILVKPQFEAGREFVGKHGLVKSGAGHRHAIERVRQTVLALGAIETDWTDSPILGGEGNREFLLYARF